MPRKLCDAPAVFKIPHLAAAMALALPAIVQSAPIAVAQTAPFGAPGAAVGCGDRGRMIGHLERRYGETLLGAGLRGSEGVMELYVSDNGGWTLLLTRPDGNSCPIAVGKDWRMRDGAAPKVGDPT